MLTSRQKHGLVVVAALAAVLGGTEARADATQVLDRVNAVSPKAVLEMAFEDPAQATPFDNPPVITTAKGFSACQLTATNGLVCLDQNNGNPGRWVRKWDPVTASGEQGTATAPYFSCEDPVLGLDTSRGAESCTGITADENGGVVIAGKRKGGYNLIKVVSKADSGISCTSTSEPWRQLTSNSGLCRKVLLPRDRPLLVDISYGKLSLPGEASCTGVLGLEVRTTLMFFKDPDVLRKSVTDPDAIDSATCSLDPLVIAGGGSWGLSKSPKEVLQGATVVKSADGSQSFAVVVSSSGRVLAKRTDLASQSPFELKLRHSSGTAGYASLPLLRNSRAVPFDPQLDPAACDTTLPQKYGIRTSTKSGSLYITDQNFCEVTALKPTGSTLNAAVDGGLSVVGFTGRDLVLATKLNNSNTTKYPPLEPTLAPGISVDLSKCADATGCTLVADASGGPAAVLSDVTLASTASGTTLFQIKNIADCRWIPAGHAQRPAACDLPGAVVSIPAGDTSRNAQYLNVAAQLPKEVTDQFPADFFKTVPMYLSPNYRAQVSEGRYFVDALFFVTPPSVQIADVFQIELFVGALTGAELGCRAPYTGYQTVSDLLKWDAVAHISEYVRTVGGPSPLSYTDMFVNVDCGSGIIRQGRTSAFLVNLEFNPEVYPHAPAPAGADQPKNPPDDYFVHVTVDLFNDLYLAQEKTGCQAGGPLEKVVTSLGPLCSRLKSKWVNAQSKLQTCITDGNYPKQNEAVANCNAFRSQVQGYLDLINAVPICVKGQPCSDPENRRGELIARTEALLHVFNDALLPSLPSNGWRYPRFEGLPLTTPTTP